MIRLATYSYPARNYNPARGFFARALAGAAVPARAVSPPSRARFPSLRRAAACTPRAFSPLPAGAVRGFPRPPAPVRGMGFPPLSGPAPPVGASPRGALRGSALALFLSCRPTAASVGLHAPNAARISAINSPEFAGHLRLALSVCSTSTAVSNGEWRYGSCCVVVCGGGDYIRYCCCWWWRCYSHVADLARVRGAISEPMITRCDDDLRAAEWRPRQRRIRCALLPPG